MRRRLPAWHDSSLTFATIQAASAPGLRRSLPVLAEARMYHTRGLLEESALFAAYEQILGVDFGRLLATGEEEDKKGVLERWLPEI